MTARIQEVVAWDDGYPWGITFDANYTALTVGTVQGSDAHLDGPAREGGTDPFKLYASNPYQKNAIEIDVGVEGKARW